MSEATKVAQHTPGPWEAAGTIVRTAVTAEDRDGLLVADCYRGSHWMPETRAANARLIAAAPDLLDALRAVVNDLDLISNLPGGSSELQEMVAHAIARATEG